MIDVAFTFPDGDQLGREQRTPDVPFCPPHEAQVSVLPGRIQWHYRRTPSDAWVPIEGGELGVRDDATRITSIRVRP